MARAVGADVYENWTDVSGFLMADPRIVKDPKPISTVSYKELRELSYMGASVLHEDAIYPARIANIPINIRNTNEPENPGTMITSEPAKLEEGQIIAGIAGSKDFTVISHVQEHCSAVNVDLSVKCPAYWKISIFRSSTSQAVWIRCQSLFQTSSMGGRAGRYTG